MPTIKKSPWAKLTIFITPQISVRPMAIREYINPINSPLTTCCNSCSGICSPSSSHE